MVLSVAMAPNLADVCVRSAGSLALSTALPPVVWCASTGSGGFYLPCVLWCPEVDDQWLYVRHSAVAHLRSPTGTALSRCSVWGARESTQAVFWMCVCCDQV